MIDTIIELVAGFITTLISSLGYVGVAIAMAIESACIPLPSEIIMPFSGYLVSTGHFNFWIVILSAGIGGLIGASLAYALGYYGGETVVRRIIKKYGKYVLVHEYELDEAEQWFRKYGQLFTFVSRLLPVIRTFISLPAGISKMHYPIFAFYAFLGTIIWSLMLTYVGLILGDNWDTLGPWFHKFDLIIVIFVVLSLIIYVNYKLKKIHRYNHEHSNYKKS